MGFVSLWATRDRRMLLDFSEAALEAFSQHVQTRGDDKEAGGMLLGTVHGSIRLILEVTVPGLGTGVHAVFLNVCRLAVARLRVCVGSLVRGRLDT